MFNQVLNFGVGLHKALGVRFLIPTAFKFIMSEIPALIYSIYMSVRGVNKSTQTIRSNQSFEKNVSDLLLPIVQCLLSLTFS